MANTTNKDADAKQDTTKHTKSTPIKSTDKEKFSPKPHSATKTGFAGKSDKPHSSSPRSSFAGKSGSNKTYSSSGKPDFAKKAPHKHATHEIKPIIVRNPSTLVKPDHKHDYKPVAKEVGHDGFVPAARKPKVSTVKHNENAFYATGKRKTSIARVWIIRGGKGGFSVNGRTMDSYFPRTAHQSNILKPFIVSNVNGNFDVKCTVKGGGVSGQAEAIRLGIAKALLQYDPDFRVGLRFASLLTRDSRIVERKKYGKHGARRSTQFSKR